MDWLPDEVIGHLRESLDTPDLGGTPYVLGRELGRGGMGTVYAAQDARLGRSVALKALSPVDGGEEAVERLWREARVLARLEHPGIVPIHDAGTLPDGRPYCVMKLVEGRRLDEYLKTLPSLPEWLRVFLRICEPVAFAHSHGVVHRDLKPENIMLGPFGEVLVLDWGVAKSMGQVERVGLVIGSAAYMAPEQRAADDVDPRADCLFAGLPGTGWVVRARARCAPIHPRTRHGTPASSQISECHRAVLRRRALHRSPAGYGSSESLPERLVRILTRHRTLALLILAYLIMRVVILFLVRR